MDKIIIEREKYYQIIQDIEPKVIDELLRLFQYDFNDEYLEYLWVKRQKLENNNSKYTNIKPMYIQLENFFVFKKSSLLPILIIQEVQDYLFKSYIDELLYNKFKQIYMSMHKIKNIIKNRLVNGYSILDNLEEAEQQVNDNNLLFSNEEKELILNNNEPQRLLRHETITGNEIVDMDATNVSYNGTELTKTKYIHYFKQIMADNYMKHLVYLYIHYWQIQICTSKEVSYYYGSIRRIKPSADKTDFIVNMKDTYRNVNYILDFLNFE